MSALKDLPVTWPDEYLEWIRKWNDAQVPNAQGATPLMPTLEDFLLSYGRTSTPDPPSPPPACETTPPPPPGFDATNPTHWRKWLGYPLSDPTEEPSDLEEYENDEENKDREHEEEVEEEELETDPDEPPYFPTEEPDSPESRQDHMNDSASEVAETASGEEMDGGNADDEGDDSSDDESWKDDPDIYAAEYQRKWEHFERQERRRLKRGIGAPQLFRHPYIEETMWEEDTPSSSDPESDEDMEGDSSDPESDEDMEGDDDRGDEETARSPWETATQKRVIK